MTNINYIYELINRKNKNKTELLEMYVIRAQKDQGFMEKIIDDFVEAEIKEKNKKTMEKIIKKRNEFMKRFNQEKKEN